MKPEYQFDLPVDHRVFRGDVAPEGVVDQTALDAITETTGVTVSLDADGLPTWDSLEALAKTGRNGEMLAARLLSEIGFTNRSKEAGALWDRFEKLSWQLNNKMFDDIDRERAEVFATLWPYDHAGNTAGQKIAAWMKKKAEHLNIVVDGKVARADGRGVVERYGPGDLFDLNEILSSASDEDFTEICPGLSRQEATRIITDPHLSRLLDVMQPDAFDRGDRVTTIAPEQVAEFLQLQEYIESLPHSVGGLKEILLAHANAVHHQLASQADYHSDLREAFEQATENPSSPLTYETYWQEQDRKANTPGKRFLRALEKLLGITN